MTAGGASTKSVRTRSFDVFMSIQEGSSHHVHLQILQGDILKEKTDVVVVFRSDTDRAEGDSLRLLQAAGDGVETEYQAAKAQGGRSIQNGITLTRAGNLEHSQHLLHLVVNENRARFRVTLAHALKLVENQQLRSIAVPHLPDNIHSMETIKTVLDLFHEFTSMNRPACLHFIQVVLTTDSLFYQHAGARQSIEFDIYKDYLHKFPIFCGRGLRINEYSKSAPARIESCRSMSPSQNFHHNEIHASLGNVQLHTDSTLGYDAHENTKIAFVDFTHTGTTSNRRFLSWVEYGNITQREVFPYACQKLSDIESIFLDYDTSVKTSGNHSLFEITLDDEPGKFPRICSAIHRVLQYADEMGIQYIIFPSKFQYGDFQINPSYLDLESFCHIFPWPLLYFKAIHSFALYRQQSNQYRIYIHFNKYGQGELLDAYITAWHSHFTERCKMFMNMEHPSSHEVKGNSFASHFTKLHIDPLFCACHLSVVKE